MNMQIKKGALLAGFAVILAACGGTTSSVASSTASSAGSSTTTSAGSSTTTSVVTSSASSTFETSNNVILYTRDTTSGTRDGFMGGIGFSPAAKDDNLLTEGYIIADNTAILTAMGGSDKYGIGYVSLSSVNNTVKPLSFNGVLASEDTVLDNTYGLKRPFNWMVRNPGDFPSESVEDIVEAFVAFMGTIEGGEAIAGAGAVALDSTTRWDTIDDQYPVCAQDNTAVTVRFGGSDSIEKVAKAVTASFRPRCGNFVAEHEHTGSGDAYKRTVGAQKDEAVGKDVAFASRNFTAAELEVNGTALLEAQYGQLAWDAIVAIVHLDNPLSNVNGDILKRMYEKASPFPIRTWADALAAETSLATFNRSNKVILYTRDTTSGTRDGFMGGIGFSPAAKDDNLLTEGYIIADNTAILTAMGGSDKYGIGYVSLSSVNNTVKPLSFNGVLASEDTVLDNTYGLKRPFNWMVRNPGDFPSESVEDIVEAFVAFMGTIEGGEAIAGAGAVALDSTTRWDTIDDQYPVCAQDNTAVTVRFGGSDSIEKVAKAVTASFRPRCGNFVAEHEHTGSGDAYKRTVGAQKDEAVGKDVAFASRNFTAAELEVNGTALLEAQYGQLAWDAIVAIVHLDNPLSNVNGDILKRMYEKASTSGIRTWADALAAEAAL